jgi:U3 small nucleolar RNA-associated protein 21
MISPRMSNTIRALAVKGHTTFVASGQDITVWERTTQTAVMKGSSGLIKHLLVLGDVLVSVTNEGCITTFSTKALTQMAEMAPREAYDEVTVLMHPSTYLDKVLVATEAGTMHLWNVKKRKAVYTFAGWGAPVNVVVQSPAVDVVGVGLNDGSIILHNLQFDEVVMRLQQAQGPVTSLSFRTGSLDSEALLASGSTGGGIYFWDLNKKRLHSALEDAHAARVSSLYFMQGEPVLVTSGEDNSIKMWIFDTVDGTARLLRQRQGHTAPPTMVRYYGDTTTASTADGADGTSLQLLSAAQDRTLRLFHAVREQMSVEFSQKNLMGSSKARHKAATKLTLGQDDGTNGGKKARRLTPITAFAAAETRERDWPSIVTAHEGDATVHAWRFDKRCITPHCLRQFDPAQHAPDGSEEARRRADTVRKRRRRRMVDVPVVQCVAECGVDFRGVV